MLLIEDWLPEHPRWPALLDLIEQEHQTRWVFAEPADTPGWHILVATRGEEIAGFLMFMVQVIGPDEGCPPLVRDGKELTEAKIRAFGVPEALRRQGIGAALQRAALRRAAELGCYQVRSWSDTKYDANYAVKVRLGFAAVPQDRNGRIGYYWVKTLALEERLAEDHD